MEFDWDEHNLFHISMHGLTREDVESALQSETLFIKDEIRQKEQRRTVAGKSAAGRILVIVTTIRGNRTRCVTAFPAKRFFRNVYIAKWPGGNLEQAEDA